MPRPFSESSLPCRSSESGLAASVFEDQKYHKKGMAKGEQIEAPVCTCLHLFEDVFSTRAKVKLPRDDMQALRMVSHLIYITSMQTRALLECFLEGRFKADRSMQGT